MYAGFLLVGCASLPQDRHVEARSFKTTLLECRVDQPQAARGLQLPATHPAVAACLLRHGWNTDGTPADPARVPK